MGTIIGWISSELVGKILRNTVFFAGSIALFFLIISLLGLNDIIIPSSIFNLLTGGNFQELMTALDFFIPVDFILGCSTTILIVRLISFMWSFALWVKRAFFDQVTGELK